MNRFTLAGAIAAFLASATALAASASGSASATVVAPVSIVNENPIAFGKFTAAAGVVTTAPDGSRSASGGAATLSSAAPGSAGQMTVSGAAHATYAISTAGGALTGSGDPMTLSNIKVAASSASGIPLSNGTIGAGGTQVIRTGGELTVAPTQAAGSYSGHYAVTVEYN